MCSSAFSKKMCSSTWMSHPHEDPDRVRGSDRDGTGARNFPNKHFGTGVGIRFRGPGRGRGAVPYPAPPRCHPWRSSLGASTHLLQLRLRPPPLTHSSLPHHRPPLRRLPLSLVLLPPGRAGWRGPPRPSRTGWRGTWGSCDARPSSDPRSRSPSQRCTLADLLQPVV
jgi:hypothetical protein